MAERGLGKGLGGKGLGALFGEAATAAPEGGSMQVPLSQVEAGLKQPRKYFDDDALAELAESIRAHGILQPLTVRRLDSGYYQIIAGERRWRAARLAGLREVPVLVVEADDRRMMELALIENLQREDLNAIEEAGGYRSLMDDYGLTQEEASARVGKSRSAVANALRLLSLSSAVQEMVRDGTLSGGHARALLSLKSGAEQEKTAARVAQLGLSVRQTEALVKKLQKPEQTAPQKPGAVDYCREAERDLAAKLARKVRILPGKKRGRLELEYYGDEDLNGLLEALSSLRGAVFKGGSGR
ncbi:MAG TPA: ParB/RepB/Spo0J family partition protein [Oscillospiraceae bacterium]|nr:ParB/RepB/Spo0J family partition protein [Oscillospiraceae bacterium]